MLETSDPQQHPPLQRNAGFTLIEIMAVVLIIGLLSTLVGVNIVNQINKSRATAAAAQISNLEAVLELYQMDNARYPSTEDGLQALVTGGPDARNFPPGGYLQKRKIPLDPWQNPFEYQQPGQNNTYSFDLCSLGSDGQLGGEGVNSDVCNWSVGEEER
jgi:general secretion pathway protein G